MPTRRRTSSRASGGWPAALRLAGWPDARECWTASLPCQPLSGLGEQRGHADERHLWPAFFRLIAERSPAVVFGEQVASPDGREWLAGVRADLERLGYAIGAACLPAASAGSPTKRERLFFVGDASGARLEGHAGHGDERDQPGRLIRDRLTSCRARRTFTRLWRDSTSPIHHGTRRRIEPGLFPLARLVGRRAYGNAIGPHSKFITAWLETRP